MTKPSAPSPKGRVPVAESAPILQNFTKVDGPMFRSTPPVRTASQCPPASRSIAASTAAKVEAQAASVMKFGPRRFRTFATRPEMMFGSSPGIVSSVIGGSIADDLLVPRARGSPSATSAGSVENSVTPSQRLAPLGEEDAAASVR